jgi:antitoxin component YwqK of YwqJK toxin-antitoxin module
MSITFNKDSTFRREHLFHNGQEFSVRGYKNNILRLEICCSADHNFELRREICKNGRYGFEGIFYKDEAFGPSNSYHCNGQLCNQCIRFNGKDIGIWKTWDEKGNIREEIDYKNLQKLDSLPIITKQ